MKDLPYTELSMCDYISHLALFYILQTSFLQKANTEPLKDQVVVWLSVCLAILFYHVRYSREYQRCVSPTRTWAFFLDPKPEPNKEEITLLDVRLCKFNQQ